VGWNKVNNSQFITFEDLYYLLKAKTKAETARYKGLERWQKMMMSQQY
jgi:hypothetical protein